MLYEFIAYFICVLVALPILATLICVIYDLLDLTQPKSERLHATRELITSITRNTK